MKYGKAMQLVESLGMSVSDDGVAFTVCGGQLVTGEDAPPALQRMNGWTVDEVATEVEERRKTAANWPFPEPSPLAAP